MSQKPKTKPEQLKNGNIIDCEVGRAMGCQAFCCRLLVRLEPEERAPAAPGEAVKGFVDKDEEGYCVHYDRERGGCKDWHNRPRACRMYDCNHDDMLQVVLKYGFTNIAQSALELRKLCIPRELFVKIPTKDDDN